MAKFRNYSILLFCIHCALVVCSTLNSTDSPEDAVEYIERVERRLNLTQNPNIILVIGNTGCGKSTLVHYAAGDYSKIFAIESSNPNSVDLDIRDELDPDRDRITSPTESRTLIPVFLTDETRTVWVDSPGFGDTRNETAEIATMFLVKNVIASATNIKIVLVVNYDSVTKTNSRDDFDNLLSRATVLMKNIERFENSVTLVVSKAPSFRIKNLQISEISDDSVKNTTAQFMVDHRSVLEKKESSGKKLQLIDALLKGPTNEYFPRISIFWRPSMARPFNEIEKMIKGRRQIRESIFNHSTYEKVQMDDFGFPLTPLAQIKVRDMVQHIINSISACLQNTINRLIAEIQQQVQSAVTIKNRMEIISVGLNCIGTKTNRREISLDLLSDQLSQLVKVYNVSTAEMKELDLELKRIVRNGKKLFMLSSLIEDGKNPTDANTGNLNYHSFSEQIVDFFDNKEAEIQKEITQKAQEAKLISTTLENFDNQLLQAMQRKIESISGLQKRLKVLNSGKTNINSTGKGMSLKQRVEQFRNLTEAYEIASINVSALNHIIRYENVLNELNSLAGSNFQLPIPDWKGKSSNAINYQLSMYDWYHFLEDTYRYFSQNGSAVSATVNEANFATITRQIRRSADYKSTPNKIIEMNQIINFTMQSLPTYECDDQSLTVKGHFIKSSDIRNAAMAKCPSFNDLTTIKVFVFDTFFVDCDLYLNKTKEVELRIMAPKWNILESSTFYLNGIDGEQYNERADEGSAGMHGEPGTNGGNFFGWANVIINSDLLSVELNGGRGGDGQDGTGSPDYNVTFNQTSLLVDTGLFKYDIFDDIVRQYFEQYGYKSKLVNCSIDVSNWYVPILAGGRCDLCTFMLYPQKCCGPTGSGGEGGNGGRRGTFDFICSSDESKHLPKITQDDGKNGDAGTNGRYCSTQKLQISIEECGSIYLFVYTEGSYKIHGRKNLHYENCTTERGLSFYPGAPKPRLNQLHGPMNIVQSLLEYKSYLLDNLNGAVVNVVQNIFDKINSDPAISSEYSTKDFAMEANLLEKHFFKLNKHVDVLSLYDDLLKRVEHISLNNREKLTEVGQKLLTLIHTMILSRTSGMQNSHQSYLIINIRNFLDLTAKNDNELDELKRIDVIKKQRDEYNDRISDKIREATSFIKNDLNPEIEQTMFMLNNVLNKVVNETIKLQSRTLHEIHAMEGNLRIIRNNVMGRTVLNIFEQISNFVGMVFGRLPQEVIGAAVKILEDNLPTTNLPRTNRHEVPTSIQHLLHKNNLRKIEAVEMELNKLNNSLQDYNVTNENVVEFLANVVTMRSQGSSDMYKVNVLIKECIESLQWWWQNVFDNSNAENKDSILHSTQIGQNALILIESSFSTYQQIFNDTDQIDQVVRAINADHETLEALRGFEDEIYSELRPMVDGMHKYLMNVEENLVGKSSVDLDVTNWKVEKTLRNVQKKLIAELAGFEVESNINDCTLRINEAFKLLIDIYERIQNYQTDSNLVTYLSKLHTANQKHLDIHDTETEKIFSELEINLKTNLVLGQYFRVLGAFKQAIFPYAADYLDTFELPSSTLTDDYNSTGLIEHASNQIESLSKNLIEYNDTVINHHDQLIHSTYFDRDIGSRGPFYVWPNSEIRNRIEQLFLGKKIYLLADIRKSGTWNAVKFNKIKLQFNSNNRTVNNELHEILQSFHVSLTHMGNSNYRCKNTFYAIPSRPWTIKYSIGERNQSPVDKNLLYSKLEAGSSLLSPYTLWSVQLLQGQFDKLQSFVDLINIELHGFGVYVEEDAPICETNLEKYYSVMDSY